MDFDSRKLPLVHIVQILHSTYGVRIILNEEMYDGIDPIYEEAHIQVPRATLSRTLEQLIDTTLIFPKRAISCLQQALVSQ